MVKGNLRSRTFRRIHVRTPAGRNVVHYRRRKKAKPQCRQCGANLLGVARGTPAQIKKLSRSQRRPERPYGGVLCSSCTRDLIKQQTRMVSK